ncbi:hypothetical protein [Sphingomonas pruni]|uniref:hypothetical protein n=1 Tax=Sphingomonas pruni TaxID=40683 RepID=UPI000AFCA556|nr:hypothetical protein [Sphingomonas pruni]
MTSAIVTKIESLIKGHSPDFSGEGRRFYGKLPTGILAYYHYLFPPAETIFLESYKGLRDMLRNYLPVLEFSNGVSLYDKCLSIYGIGDLLSRSLNPAEMVAFSFERENILFLNGNKAAPNATVGTIDLSIRYQIELDENACCILRGEDGFSRLFVDLDEGITTVLSYFERQLSFCTDVTDQRIARIEGMLREHAESVN